MTKQPRRNISQRSEMVYDVHTFNILLDTREIFLSSDQDYHYDEAMLDHKAANTFIKNLQMLNNKDHDNILVHMITNGGDWNYGMAIYDAIKYSSSYITILAYGHARSMSSIIPQAAKWRVIMPNADFLIHWGTDEISGSHTSVQAEADWSKRSAEIMLDVYAERCKDGQFFKREGMDEKQIRQWIGDQMTKKQEFYMTAREAVDKGFMDAVLGDEEFESVEKLKEEDE